MAINKVPIVMNIIVLISPHQLWFWYYFESILTFKYFASAILVSFQ